MQLVQALPSTTTRPANNPEQEYRRMVSERGRRVTIRGKDGSFGAYVADAKNPGGPANVVIQRSSA